MDSEAIPSIQAFRALEGAETESSSPWVVSREAADRFYQVVYGRAEAPAVGVSPCILLLNVRGGKDEEAVGPVQADDEVAPA